MHTYVAETQVLHSGRSVDVTVDVKKPGGSTVDVKSEWQGYVGYLPTQIHRPLLKIPSFSPSTVPSTVRPLTAHCPYDTVTPTIAENWFACPCLERLWPKRNPALVFRMGSQNG